MNQKEYELIGSIFKKNITTTDPKELRHNVPTVSKATALQFAAVFANHYPKTFDRTKFLTACGMEDDLVKTSDGRIVKFNVR